MSSFKSNVTPRLALMLMWYSSNVHAQSNCIINISTYAVDYGSLTELTGGGQASGNKVVFDIPAFDVNGGTTFCLEKIKIPTHVEENECNDFQKCWLSIAMKVDRVGDDLSCHCFGSSMQTGEYDLSDNSLLPIGYGCGPAVGQWGTGCQDVLDGQILNAANMTLSEYATVHFSVCPEISDNCGICRRGQSPPMKVRSILSKHVSVLLRQP
jgi:hypothetical protein